MGDYKACGCSKTCVCKHSRDFRGWTSVTCVSIVIYIKSKSESIRDTFFSATGGAFLLLIMGREYVRVNTFIFL